MILVYLNSKKVSIIWLLQRVHSETKYHMILLYITNQSVYTGL